MMKDSAKKILSQLMDSGFDEARVTLMNTQKDELFLAHNKASHMRSTESGSLGILAIRDNRKVTGSITSSEPEAVRNLISRLKEDVATSPVDKANAVCSGQIGSFVKGPREMDRDSMIQGAKELLSYREKNYPGFQIEGAQVQYDLQKQAIVSSRGSELELSHGFYTIVLEGASKDEHGSSSFNYTYGMTESIPHDIQNHLNISEMMANSALETRASKIDGKFTGDIILMPLAAGGLFEWLFGQLEDFALLNDSSLFKNSVGETIASDLLSITHTLEGAGVPPFNREGFLLKPFPQIEKGRLNHLIPGYYGSRKLNLPHYPTGWGWDMAPGGTSREQMISSVKRGALVGRLSMGSPASNGDFSGVIKNSFLIEDGRRTRALSETMISGNAAQMLKDITAVSREVTNFGTGNFPWVQIKGVQFS